MKKIGIDTLSHAKAAESTLRREEIRGLTEAIPPGHPLEEEVAQAQAAMNGDLDGLPDNHPLMLELRAAKERYSQEGVEEAADEQKEAREIRQANKVDRNRLKRDQRDKEDTASREQRVASETVNADVMVTLASVKNLYETLGKNEGVLSRHRMNATRVLRLKRLLTAIERGLSDIKMSRE